MSQHDRGHVQGATLGSDLVVPPKVRVRLSITYRFTSSLMTAGYDDQVPSLPRAPTPRRNSPVITRALLNIEGLLLTSAQGPVIAVGIPNFVIVFGRDSLSAAWLLLDVTPQLASSTCVNRGADLARA